MYMTPSTISSPCHSLHFRLSQRYLMASCSNPLLYKDRGLMKDEDALKCNKGLFHHLISLASDDCAHGAPTHHDQSLHPHAKKGSHAPSSVVHCNPHAGLTLDDDS